MEKMDELQVVLLRETKIVLLSELSKNTTFIHMYRYESIQLSKVGGLIFVSNDNGEDNIPKLTRQPMMKYLIQLDTQNATNPLFQN